ncbi:MAG TPA: nodulation protein NfeD [Alphaproteobacteria bacterium]
MTPRDVPRPFGAGALRPLRCTVAVAMILAAIAAGLLFAPQHTQAQVPAPKRADLLVIELQGVIGVAAAAFVSRGIEQAQAMNARAVVIRMDTPGGLVSATRDIISDILASPVPVVVYVAPGGARAASAGTYILYAAHLAAMAPGTHLGAATPIGLGPPPGMPGGPERQPEPTGEKPKSPDEPGSAAERKALNDAIAYLRSLAELRGRNADFAERAVREAATMTATEAATNDVVDLLAPDIPSLLAAIDGRTISIAGATRRLETKDAAVETLSPNWRERAIGIVTDPNVAYLLLLLGFYGLFFELWNPGFILPGVVGGICLLIALAALSVMPVSYAGLALILLGIALLAGEAFTPGVGVLGIGGLVAFVTGSIFLFEPGAVPFDFGVAWPVIAGATAITSAFFLFVIGFALKARQRPVVTGIEELVGSRARVIEWTGDRGLVHVRGEIWQARAAEGSMPAPPAAGDSVRIRALDGLVLIVEPAKHTLDQPGR